MPSADRPLPGPPPPSAGEVCTIYDPRFPEAAFQRVAVAALALFNEAITRAASARGLPLIDLRLICDEDADFANPIEPSAQGGAKIAAAIADLLTTHDFASGRSVVFAGGPRPRGTDGAVLR